MSEKKKKLESKISGAVSSDEIQRQSLTKANAFNDMADLGLEMNLQADGSKGGNNSGKKRKVSDLPKE